MICTVSKGGIMEVLSLNNDDFENLEPYELDDTIWHGESKIYYDPTNKKRILKIYHSHFNKKWKIQKLKAIKNLIKFTDEYNIPEIIWPEGLVNIDKDFKGIILPIIPGNNASIYLSDGSVPKNIKIDILKQIATILEKIKNTKSGACFADVHSDNFLIDGIETGNIKAKGIDTESMRIYNSPGVTNFYLLNNGNLYSNKKYNLDNVGIIWSSLPE